MSESELYAKLLLPRKHGFPLWKPDPNQQLAEEYRYSGQRIGDVGIITRDGGFDFLFNICHKADHPIHIRGVPPSFDPIDPATLELDERHGFHNPKTDITTQNIRKTDIEFGLSIADNVTSPGAVVGFEFHVALSSSEGAILMLPDGASRMDLHNRKPFYEMACQNATAWYQYATETRGRMISDDSLYLVTGCDKCTSWGVAAFSETFGAVSSTLKLIATSVGGALSYSWQKPTSVAARSGPSYLPEQPIPLLNQISLRRRRLGSKLKTRITLIEENKAGLVLPKVIVSPASDSQSTRSSLFPDRHSTNETQQRLEESVDMEAESNSSSSSLSSSGEDEMLLQEIPEPSEGLHPLDAINHYLLDKMDSTVAVTHDDVWTSVLDKNEDRLPDFRDFINRIEKRYPAVLHKALSSAGVASFASDFVEANISLSLKRSHEENVLAGLSNDLSLAEMVNQLTPRKRLRTADIRSNEAAAELGLDILQKLLNPVPNDANVDKAEASEPHFFDFLTSSSNPEVSTSSETFSPSTPLFDNELSGDSDPQPMSDWQPEEDWVSRAPTPALVVDSSESSTNTSTNTTPLSVLHTILVPEIYEYASFLERPLPSFASSNPYASFDDIYNEQENPREEKRRLDST
ncbi:hypothetical protein C8J56DRAFT_885889 [Mycena floridula]|nr:hypothetical protein C8J56DRAFT_885889 [Mycena floridula]